MAAPRVTLAPVRLIGAACGLGGPSPGPALAPSFFSTHDLASMLSHGGRPVSWLAQLSPPEHARWPALAAHLTELSDAVAASDGLPVVIGGDHTVAVGTWRGVARRHDNAPFGLLWIDAHLDSHTPADSESGNPHGMSLAALLGEDVAPLAGVPGGHLDPSRVVIIGARSWEPSEMKRLNRLGVRVFDAQTLVQGGRAVLDEALRIVRAADGRFGITVDLDVFSPDSAPGVTTPERGGPGGDTLLTLLRGLATDPGCVGVELTEYDPSADVDDRTARLATEVLASLLAPADAVLRQWEDDYGARNYAPAPVILAHGEGALLFDRNGKSYIDMMAAYSAVSFGHANPRLVAALADQAARLGVTSRGFRNDRLPVFLRRLTELTGYDRALPMNTGAEAVETALKAARKWGYKIKGIPEGQAEIIACDGNFHGRTTAIVGLSSEAQYRDGFGPFPAGLKRVPYGDAAALEAAITPHTCAFLVEPIQGEGGIVVPPTGYLAACAAICKRHNVLLIADEIQTGLGRTGRLLASEHEHVRPDGVCLGKALGGGLLPVSAFLADDALMQVYTPGDHGSTFGGNPLASAVALEALDVMVSEGLIARADRLGRHLMARLHGLRCAAVREVRGIGLFAGIEIAREYGPAKGVVDALIEKGVLSKETHETVIRLAPPLTIPEALLDEALDRIESVLVDLAGQRGKGNGNTEPGSDKSGADAPLQATT